MDGGPRVVAADSFTEVSGTLQPNHALQRPRNMTTIRTLRTGIAAVLLTITAGCAGSVQGIDSSASPGAGPLRVELESEETFESAAPSGRFLLTQSGGSLCVRSGPEYGQRECADVAIGSAIWFPTWSPDERHVAVVSAGSSRAGEQNDAVWVLDVAGLTAVAVTPTDQWLTGPPVPYWLGVSRLGYLWPLASVTQARVSDLDGIDELVAEHGDLEVESVLAADDAAIVAVAGSGRTRGVFRLTPDGRSQLVHPLGENHLLGSDRPALRIITQVPDPHYNRSVQMIDLRTHAESELFPDGGATVQIAFSPDDAALAVVTPTSPTNYSVAVRQIDRAAAPEAVVTVDVPDRTYLYDGILWTDTAIVLPCSTDGAAQVVLVLRRSSDL